MKGCIQKYFSADSRKEVPPLPHIPLNRKGEIQRGGFKTQPGALAHVKNKKVGDEMAGKRAPAKSNIKESLLKQLETKNANVPHFYDLICDYMVLYDTKRMLQADIKKRGVSYETTSASGYKITKQNQSVKDLVAVNKQMMAMLREMGLTTDKPTGETEENEDL